VFTFDILGLAGRFFILGCSMVNCALGMLRAPSALILLEMPCARCYGLTASVANSRVAVAHFNKSRSRYQEAKTYRRLRGRPLGPTPR
jgi:hypothetical protein